MAILFKEFNTVYPTKWKNIKEFLADDDSRIEFQMHKPLMFQVSFFDDEEGPDWFLEENESEILKILNQLFKEEYKSIYHIIARFIDGEDIIEVDPESILCYIKTKIFLDDVFNEKSWSAFFIV
jgi:hypothetical protein